MGIGDELMVTGQARVMQQTDPRKVLISYEKPRWHDVWNGNPRIARPEERGDFQILHPRIGYLRPYIRTKTRQRWFWRAYTPPVGEIYFTEEEIAFGDKYADRIIFEPHIKIGASPNKQWGWMRWSKLAWLAERKGIKFAQLGMPGTPELPSAEFIETGNFRLAAAVLARARVAVLHEGAMHHACAALGTKAVVIFGGFISPAVTGYATQTNFYTGEGDGLGCGNRTECLHCKLAMGAVRPDVVFTALENYLAN